MVTVFYTHDLLPKVWKVIECGLCNDTVHQNESLVVIISYN
jgi:hypothetical protein